jgi:hypothetical protein
MSSPEMERLKQRLKEAYEERQAMTPEERAAFDERHRPMRERMQAEQGPGGTHVISEADDEEE